MEFVEIFVQEQSRQVAAGQPTHGDVVIFLIVRDTVHDDEKPIAYLHAVFD